MKILKCLLLILFCIVHCISADIGNVKGTYCILKDLYRSSSVIHGAVAWETGTIRRMYDFGALGKKGKDIESATIRLVHNLFHRPPNTTSEIDFVVSKNIKDIDDYRLIQFVAYIVEQLTVIAEMVDWQAKNSETLLLDVYRKKYTEWQSATKEEIKKFLKAELDKIKNMVINSLKSFELDQDSDVPEEKFKSDKKRLQGLIKLIVASYFECTVQGYMPSYTTQMILEALLWAKTKGHRGSLEVYYKALEKNKPGCLSLPGNWDEWRSDIFTRYDIASIESNFRENSSGSLSCAEYEKLVFVKYAPRVYPSVCSVATAEITINGKKYPFSDCMDNVIRNMINFLSYNQKTGLFDLVLLQERLGVVVHDSLKSFYEKHADESKASEALAHNDWVQYVTSNIPHVDYAHIVNDSYKSFAYELNPSIKNLILVLNYLLNLKLFEAQEDLVDVLEDKNFSKIYLPQLAEKLKGRLSSEGGLTGETVRFSFEFDFQKYPFTQTLTLSPSHGELSVDTSGQEYLSNSKYTGELPLSALFLLDINVVTENNSNTTPIFLWLFSRALDNPDVAFNLIKALSEKNIWSKNIGSLAIFLVGKQPDIFRRLSLLKLIVEKGQAYNEAIRAARKALESYDKDIQNSGLDVFRALFEKKQGYQAAVNDARIAIDFGYEYPHVRASGLGLLSILVEAGQGEVYKEALNEAQRAVANENLVIRDPGEVLLRALVEKGQGYKEIIAMRQAYLTKNVSVKKLLEELYLLIPEDARKEIEKFEFAAEKDKAKGRIFEGEREAFFKDPIARDVDNKRQEDVQLQQKIGVTVAPSFVDNRSLAAPRETVEGPTRVQEKPGLLRRFYDTLKNYRRKSSNQT